MRKIFLLSLAVLSGWCEARASLPAGYTELPYVESTGANQWIYTDYVPEWNHRIVVKFRVNQVGTWQSPGVFCARGTANNDRGYCLRFAQGGSSRPNLPGQIELFTGGWAMQSGYYLDLNTDCEVDVNYSQKKWRIDVGGEASEMSTRDHITFTAGSSLAIFCHHTLGDSLGKKSTVADSNYLNGRIYYLRAYDDNGDLIHEFVPACNEHAAAASERLGLYDTVAQKFWPNCSSVGLATDPSFAFTRTVDRAQYDSDEAAGAALLAAISATEAGERVKITAGTVAAPHIYKISAPVVLAETAAVLFGDSGNAAEAIIDAGGVSAGVVATGANCRVTGLTVRNAIGYDAGTAVHGGGLALLGDGCYASNCVVSACRNERLDATKNALGGGVSLKNSSLYDTLVCDCSVGGVAYNQYGGGVYVEATADAYAPVVSNCVVTACAATNTVSLGAAWGGGIALKSNIGLTADVLVCDCKVATNFVTACGGGIAILEYSAGTTKIINCEISGNEIDSQPERTSETHRMSGSGIHSSVAATIQGCRIKGNRADAPYKYWLFGAAVRMSGGELKDCVLEENESNSFASGLAVSQGAGVSVTGCAFRGNANSSTSPGGAMYIDRPTSDMLVADSYFVANTTEGAGGAVYSTFNTEVELRLRNCLVTGNTGARGILTFKSGGTSNPSSFCVENCTVVSNTCGQSAIWPDVWNGSKSYENVHVLGCVVLWNGIKAFYNSMTDVKYSCYSITDSGTSDASYADDSNVIYDSSKPLFVDAASGDYRPTKGSQLRDKVPRQSWMGDGKKNPDSVYDLGSGYEVMPVGRYGVTVNRVNAVPRRFGDAADIGCSEYWQEPSGLILIFR